MAAQITMPKLGLSMKTGTVAKWLKNEGDRVKKGEPVVEIMTEKITNTVEAPEEGILLKIVASKGAKLPIGALLGVIGSEGEDISALLAEAPGGTAAAASAAPAAGERIKISPAARKLAEENGIDYTRIKGTGPEGRITREDVERAIAEGIPAADDRPTLEVIPYEGMRRAIGDNMAHSWAVAPKVTHHTSVDLSGIIALRREINEGVKEKDKVSITAFLVKAVAKALELKPAVNATLDGEEIKVLQDINIGVAVALPDGLIVPVVRNADQKDIYQVNKEIRDLAKRARRNKLEPDEMTGGTFTVTNLGAYGSVDWFTPIINQPESAILGVGRTVERPVVVNGEITIRPMLGLSLAFDHRVIDGAPAAEFLKVLIDLIEKPYRIFI
ncbi:dihydrolipoyllysine-residue acetyltransferase component of acetoin cleaving system [Thermacetogenium phaeum DSM 12270]|jgi:pyruvate dehydrogenase E2 component (dihydrolipoamide acetyltransferase)|uniref:Dihydrolipoamide acetyltransferase component of pyruvate dehydrogenase complex n=1 Tax=Thermacetogenium phaeum (strain ATCC BAA-254 / DSM 26808 / PB) TaxID=1089553 RepID=K4LGL4_THEPS|nr:dihydrolipoamide acetyltransferase family protein [Thermacetogenium phaeum]AFV12156.1 dihydrolipoyllysine-residue acetyltransferase component of acetoin cleaving system [Thermacetogenium phaeum DSM 12270]